MDQATEIGPARWWHLAGCRDEDPELFFPIGTGEATARQVAAAERVCARCPVRAACREYALAHPEPTGVWGGMSEEERRAERARRRETPQRSASASTRGDVA